MAGAGNSIFVILLFLLTGLLVGGVWSTYQNGSKTATAVLAVLAVVAALFALLMMLEVM